MENDQPQSETFNLILEFAKEQGLLEKDGRKTRKSKQIDKSQRDDK